MAEDFLKNLQQSLKDGDKENDAVKHLNEIDKKADEMDSNKASELLTKRIEDGEGFAKELTVEEREKTEAELVKVVAEQQDNDEKLKYLAQIESQNARIRKLKKEYGGVKEKFSKKIQEIYDYKITLMANFEKQYDKKAEEVYDFGDEPTTDLDEHDTQY